MANILVAGALDLSRQSAQDFARYLGEAIIKQEHILLNGCLNELDSVVAKGAFDWLEKKGQDPDKHIISYIIAGKRPVHKCGKLFKSELTDWGLIQPQRYELYAPEQIDLANVVILVGGGEGTTCAANWARIKGKPLLPITAFGGAAEGIYKVEIRKFESKYARRIDRSLYETLNQVSSDWEKIAKDVVALAERIISPKDVFVIMSFSDDPKLEDAYESFREVCEEYQYECRRIDDTDDAIDRIVPEILANIEKSAFVIVDLTEEKANVYYELGFAQGLDKPVVITAHKGTPLPFDVKDIPTIFWENQKQLKEKLREKIGKIASLHGR